MIAVRVIVGVLAVSGVAAVMASVLRTVVVPRAVPARLARAAFLSRALAAPGPDAGDGAVRLRH